VSGGRGGAVGAASQSILKRCRAAGLKQDLYADYPLIDPQSDMWPLSVANFVMWVEA
jgi:hypothetical protein